MDEETKLRLEKEIEEQELAQKTKEDEDQDFDRDLTDLDLGDKDKDGDDPDDKSKNEDKEPWMLDDDDDDEEDDGDGDDPDGKKKDVPVTTHIKVKKKLKGRLTDAEEENRRLREENERLKNGGTQPQKLTKPIRPKRADFDTDDEYNEAVEVYDDKMATLRYHTVRETERVANDRKQFKKSIDDAVDAHYDRAVKLTEVTGITPEVFKKTDENLRQEIELISPGRGDIIADQMIAILGEGSEKVMYYLGRNKNALATVKTLLVEDPNGLKLATYIGEQKARLLNTTKRRSSATKPGSRVQGDKVTNSEGKAVFKKYQKAMKAGNYQAAFDLKRKAKGLKLNTKEW